MFLDVSEIKTTIAAYLKTTPDQLQAYFDPLIADAYAWATNEIVGALEGRAFSLGQIQSWDRGGEYQKSLAAFWILTQGGVTHNYDDKFLARLDKRAELQEVQVLNSQQFQAPASTVGRSPSDTNLGKTGRIGYGKQNTTGDTYTMGGFTPPLVPDMNRNPW